MIVFLGLWALISTLLIYEFGTCFDSFDNSHPFYKFIVWMGCVFTALYITAFFCAFLYLLVSSFLGAAL